jgi:hypothetical protein
MNKVIAFVLEFILRTLYLMLFVKVWGSIFDALRGVNRRKEPLNASQSVLEREIARLKATEAEKRTRKAAKAASRPDALLNNARKLLERGEVKMARERLKEIIKVYPDTEAAKKAWRLLERMSK